jgi:hypothetical protein
MRAIMDYAALTDARDRLTQARSEGARVADLPPGMTLEEALEKIEARITDHDQFVIDRQDGYLVRYRPKMDTSPDKSAESGEERSAGTQESADAR